MTNDEARVMKALQSGQQLTAEQLAGASGLEAGRVHEAVMALADRGLLAPTAGTPTTTWELSANGRGYVQTTPGRAALDIPPIRKAARR
ncbi:hypothetical protein [Nocardia sp. NPDC050710]|uniref:hypothetical protein n=1 Tax=Nocardia sp. NPDC050710 TaxID=3157220 RepID=UPI00340FD3E9